MNDREKLIELLGDFPMRPSSMKHIWMRKGIEELADYLLAHGFTMQRWIPVTERLPELIPCDAGTAYSEAINILTSGRKVFTAIWDGFEWICDAEFWDAEDEEITHWAPVLLPLPKPTKEADK